MNKLVIYLIALISGMIGVFAFSPFDYWGLAYVSLGGLLFVGNLRLSFTVNIVEGQKQNQIALGGK